MKKLVKFEKNDCNPCAMVSDLLDKKGVEYERINPFDNPELAVKYRVRSVPTVILFEIFSFEYIFTKKSGNSSKMKKVRWNQCIYIMIQKQEMLSGL